VVRVERGFTWQTIWCKRGSYLAPSEVNPVSTGLLIWLFNMSYYCRGGGEEGQYNMCESHESMQYTNLLGAMV